MLHFTSTGAQFSNDRKYRYALWRTWDEDAGHLLIVGHNPSRADEYTDDHTVRRGIHFVKAWGYGGITMCNLAAWCATNPRELDVVRDAVGPHNWYFLTMYADSAAGFLMATGNPHKRLEREFEYVYDMLREHGPVYCIGVTKAGYPRHLSRVANSATKRRLRF